jgi:aminomethyltransferase
MLKRTPLYEQHLQLQAQIVPFANWEMPLNYGSQIKEHHAVRQHAGIFDISHMGIVDIKGNDSAAFLQYVLANDIQKLQQNGAALYSCLLNEKGGVVDDLIAYRITPNHYRLIINAACHDKDVQWLRNCAQNFDISIEEKLNFCIIALQGPTALAVAKKVLPDISRDLENLQPFQAIFHHDSMFARTGYTGEDGFEIVMPPQAARALWQACIAEGATPCGLGARDTLRLEAGLNLYGIDMDENTSPWVSNLGWTISLKDPARDFIGKQALLAQKQAGIQEKMVGLILEHPGVLRNHQAVWIENDGTGEITSGGFSPTLGVGVALARIPITAGTAGWIEKREQKLPIKIVRPPFVRHGKKVFKEII